MLLGSPSAFCRTKDHLVKVCQENLKILSGDSHRILSKMITSDETYVHYYDSPTNQESKIWLFEDESPSIQLKQKQILGEMYVHWSC